MRKKYLWLISIILPVLFAQTVQADKLSITKHDSFLSTDTNFFDANGNKLYLDQFEGGTVLLVFWATWCGTCVSELPSLDNLQKDFSKLPFKVIALSEDYQGIEAIKEHFTQHEIRHLEIFHDRQNQLFRSLEIVSLPTAYLINATGKLKLVFKGRVKWHDEEVRKMILAEIKGVNEQPKNTYKSSSLNKQVARSKNTTGTKKVTPEGSNSNEQGIKEKGNANEKTK
ncbi:MAG: TlpA disulfide reductase family protein [Rickettsiaceae bacterium]